MLLKCLGNEASYLPDNYRKTYAPEGCSNRKWTIIIGKEYLAGGIIMFSAYVLYLICREDDAQPEFVPAPFFRIADQRLPATWRYWAVDRFYENNLQCVIGYPELTDGTTYYDDLVERKPSAVSVFRARLAEMEQELEGNSRGLD